MLPAGVAVLGVERLEAGAAVRSSLLHDVALASQHGLALEAAEVLHVPVATLGLGALIGKDDLREQNENERHSSQVHGAKASAGRLPRADRTKVQLDSPSIALNVNHFPFHGSALLDHPICHRG